ncbi:MAG: alpha,alpha-phosphotrehalase [Firmicutes bacterium]|nr:alpha,alpha-phosphotrehalase [Bacillota bacterium]
MEWWKKAVVYQIYPRSFMDTNQDSIGDIQGIISRLDYLKYLGINVIWLCPVYASPNEDNGYDISDYYDLSKEYGSMKDMEELIFEAKKRDIFLMMDIVANHTSKEHRWFIEASSDENNLYHEYYVFKDNNGVLPSDLQSVFLDSAWELNPATNEYYLHLFAKGQPDLNWHHEPVRKSIYDILNFWIDKGIKGFRFDVIDLIAKDMDHDIIGDGPLLHPYIKEMAKNTFKDKDLITVGETWGATVEKAKMYSNPDHSEFSMIFNFAHILLDQEEGKEKWDLYPLDLIKLKQTLNEQQQELYQAGWNSLFWNNHDLPRIVSRWGNDQEYRVESAKMLATLLHFMQGTPYIYQGEEIGMTNMKFENLEDLRDIESLNMIKQRLKLGYDLPSIMKSIHAKGRDNARTPYQWNNKVYAGFSEEKPWIKCNPNYVTINMESQKNDPDSILEHYKTLIWFRRKSLYSDVIARGTFKLIYQDHPDLFAYQRSYQGKCLTVLCNFHNTRISLPDFVSHERLLLSNYKDSNMTKGLNLRPYESIVLFSNQ